MPRIVMANQATASKRRVYFHCVDATDGITPETSEAGQQPQISINGASWVDAGIGTLTAIGNGRYYADLAQATVATAGDIIETRYKSANTAETPGDTVQVVAFNPDDIVRLGMTALPNAAANAAGGLPTSTAGGLDLDTLLSMLDATISSRSTTSEILNSIVETEGNYTLQQVISIVLAVLAGITSDRGRVFKTPNGLATRVTSTVNADHERTSIIINPSA